MRAMEEQHMRSNPMGEGPSLEGQMRGSGATPSMGLSQFRGGAMERCVGSGTKKGQMRKTARRAFVEDSSSEDEMVGEGHDEITESTGSGRGMSDATAMGLHLGKHLHSLHGAGFFDDFVKGIGSAVSTIAPIAQTAMKFAPMLGLGRKKKAPSKLKRRIRNGKLIMGGESNSSTGAYEGEGRERDDMEMTGIEHGGGMFGQDGHGQMRGGGFLSDLGIPGVSQLAGMIGLGHDEVTESTGTGRRKRAKRPVGENDGRRKRAEIVRKVMNEKGMKMIEASKYVKAHGLY